MPSIEWNQRPIVRKSLKKLRLSSTRTLRTYDTNHVKINSRIRSLELCLQELKENFLSAARILQREYEALLDERAREQISAGEQPDPKTGKRNAKRIPAIVSGK